MVIDIDLKYHTVVFGSYEDIGPKPDTLKYFIEKFSDKELIPTTFQELGPKGVVNRFKLTASDEVWLIVVITVAREKFCQLPSFTLGCAWRTHPHILLVIYL